jgi:hypothetical protein
MRCLTPSSSVLIHVTQKTAAPLFSRMTPEPN